MKSSYFPPTRNSFSFFQYMIMSLSFSSSKFDLFSELWHTREYGQREDKDILTIFGPYLDHLFSSDFSSVSQSDSHGPVKDIFQHSRTNISDLNWTPTFSEGQFLNSFLNPNEPKWVFENKSCSQVELEISVVPKVLRNAHHQDLCAVFRSE